MLAGSPARLVAALTVLVALLALAPGVEAHDRPVQEITVTAHDDGGGDYWFTTNETGDTRNPAIPWTRGAHVELDFVVEGTLAHNLTLDDPVGFRMPETYTASQAPPANPLEFTFTIPWDAPDTVAYWCEPHKGLGMKGNATVEGAGNAAPNLAVEAPSDGAAVEGTVEVRGDALDDDGDAVTVEVRPPEADAWQEAGGTGDWSFSWDSTQVDDGDHTLEVRATDAHGAVVKTTRDVNVVNDRNEVPTVSFTDPPPGSEVRGTVTLEGEAGDADGSLDRVEVRLPPADTWTAADGLADWSHEWNASAAETGNHTLRVRAVDDEGATTEETLTVTVVDEAANRAPRLSVSRPTDGDQVQGSTLVAGNASDADGQPVAVEVRLPGTDAWRDVDGPDADGAWHVAWNASKAEPGDQEVAVRATDGEATTYRNVTVEVPGQENRPPTVAIASPEEGAVVAGDVTVLVEAGDVDQGDAVDRVRARFADRTDLQAASRSGDTWEVTLSTQGLPSGEARIVAVADDGEEVSKAVRRVTVDETRPTPPEVELTTNPPEVATDLVVLRGEVSDVEVESGSLSVELAVDGELVDFVEKSNPGTFQLAWQTHRAEEGVHDVTVQAHDASAASEPVTLVMRVDNEPDAETEGLGAAMPAPGPGVAAALAAAVAAARRRA